MRRHALARGALRATRTRLSSQPSSAAPIGSPGTDQDADDGHAGPATWATVALVHTYVLQFRRGFHNALRDELARRGIELVLVHGFPYGEAATKADSIQIDWAHHVRNHVIHLGRRQLVWSSALRHVRDADLVIVTQQSSLLFNYVMFARHQLGRQRMAFWGHGRNLDEAERSRLGEAVKRFLSTRVHWWFAYTDMTARIVAEMGFPPARITVARNAVDTRRLREHAAEIDAADVERLRAELGVAGDHVALYVGGMYGQKRLPFLIDACEHVREQLPDFHMIFLGTGPDAHLVEAAAQRHSWIHVVGPAFDEQKVRYFAMSKLMLLPGRVGLAIVDALALGTPLVTVADSAHSPEIEYLQPGENGEMLPAGTGPAEYADVVVRLLRDEQELQRLSEGATASSSALDVQEMARRFADGAEAALRS